MRSVAVFLTVEAGSFVLFTLWEEQSSATCTRILAPFPLKLIMLLDQMSSWFLSIPASKDRSRTSNTTPTSEIQSTHSPVHNFGIANEFISASIPSLQSPTQSFAPRGFCSSEGLFQTAT
jgi:hypothetical protein